MPYVLIVDGDETTRTMLGAAANAQQLANDAVATLAEARCKIRSRVPDVVFMELNLPDGNGLELFDAVPRGLNVEMVPMTANASVESAIEALRHGAADYLQKPINVQRLDSILARVPRTDELCAEIADLRAQLQRLGRFGRMLGSSPAMQKIYEAIARVAPSEASVMLTGESGTGKELAAQTVHDLSLRRKGPFVVVNCGAIAANLVESELFGHDRGSFTGADRQHKGFFERAHGGTLFLDEVTEMPLASQVKLLRVLETGRLTRLGGNQEIEVDVRIVAATNVAPEAAVERGTFRLDLFHRLNVFPITMPPLRERGDDIAMLANAFLHEFSERSGRRMRFSQSALDALGDYSWDGNVRELRNLVQRAHILTEGDVIESLPRPAMLEADEAIASDDTVVLPVESTLEALDRALVNATLAKCGGVKAHAAEILEVSLKTLYNRLDGAHDEKTGTA